MFKVRKQPINQSPTHSPILARYLRLRPGPGLQLPSEALCWAPGGPQAIRLPVRRGRRDLQGKLPEVWEPGRQRQRAGPVRDRAPRRQDPDNLLHRRPPARIHRRGQLWGRARIPQGTGQALRASHLDYRAIVIFDNTKYVFAWGPDKS